MTERDRVPEAYEAPETPDVTADTAEGRDLAAPPPSARRTFSVQASPAGRPGDSPTPMQRSPFFAGLLSALLPGMGNVYNGLLQRGVMTFLLGVSLLFTAAQSNDGPIFALLVPSMIFVWLFAIIDASRQASLINHGLTETDLPSEAARGGGGVAVGVAFVLIGLYGLLSQVFEIDLSVLADFWYVLLMAFGGWLIYQSIQQRRHEEARQAALGYDESI